MPVVSNGQFWMCTFALLIIWIIVLTTAYNNDLNLKIKVLTPNDNVDEELKNTGNCKALCKYCGCLGFYCGEECICECNNDHSDTECINTMQTHAKKLNTPFEILIQGPTINKFVRNALQFEQDFERRSLSFRSKRSTVTIYKPYKVKFPISLNKSDEKTLIEDDSIVSKKTKDRLKRSTNQFEWFSDLANNLVRPAPLGGRKRKSYELKKPTDVPKRSASSSIFDNSWFSENSYNILTPAPLFKRKSSKLSSNLHNNKKDINTSGETYKISEKRLPVHSKNTLHQLSENRFSDNFDDSHEIFTKTSGESKESNIQDNHEFSTEEKNMKTLQDIQTDSFYSHLFKDDLDTSDNSVEKPTNQGLPEFGIPWFRPFNFFKKVQQVINS